MKNHFWLTLRTFASLLILAGIATAQPALDKLEERLQQRAPAKPEDLPLPPDEQEANRGQRDEAGYLGIIADDRQERGQGVRVIELVPDGPAAQGGLKVGDLLVAANSRRLASMQDLGRIIENSHPGDQVKFDVQRAGAREEASVKLGRRPPVGQRRFEQFGPIDAGPQGAAPPDAAPRRRLLGVRTLPVSEDAQRFFGLPEARGALVNAVVADSPAAKAGIPPDAVIVEVDHTPINQPADLARLVTAAGAGREIELAYYSRGALVRKKVVLADVEAAAAAQEAPRPAENGAPEDEAVAAANQQGPSSARLDKLERQLRLLEKRLEQIEAFLQRLPPMPPLPQGQRGPAGPGLPANET